MESLPYQPQILLNFRYPDPAPRRQDHDEDDTHHTLFNARLADALAPRPGREGRRDVGVLYLDLDGFKAINDTHGHDAGVEVLLTTAQRLRTVSRPQDTVARLGGHEFAVAAPRITARGLLGLADRITTALAEPQLIHGTHSTVPASVGTYLAATGEPASEALRHAD